MTLNERISAWFEPIPEPVREDYRRSIGGCWWRQDYPDKTMRPNEYYGPWQPIPWDTDEAANARLLDRLIQAEQGEECRHLSFSPVMRLVRRIISEKLDRKTAVVLAFAKFASLPVDDSSHEVK